MNKISLQTMNRKIWTFLKSPIKKTNPGRGLILVSFIDSHPTIPKIYGLQKIHKHEIPIQPIISRIDLFLYYITNSLG